MLTDADLHREMTVIKQQVRQLERPRGVKAMIVDAAAAAIQALGRNVG